MAHGSCIEPVISVLMLTVCTAPQLPAISCCEEAVRSLNVLTMDGESLAALSCDCLRFNGRYVHTSVITVACEAGQLEVYIVFEVDV
jgi:hypothetical protein